MTERRPRIVWGITASVAAIRASELARLLLPIADLQVIITEKAKRFPLDLPSELRVLDDEREWSAWRQLGDPVLHIELRRWADLLLVAPASADLLAKMSYGFADNLLLCVARAWDFSKPAIVAPAMNTKMWEHPTTAEHLQRLRSWGVGVIEPVEKMLACADVGMGALAPLDQIASEVARVIQATSSKALKESST